MEKRSLLIIFLSLILLNLSFGQPVLLKELPSTAGNYITSNGKLYYTSSDSLFRSDGTPAGTVFVKKIGESSIKLFGLTTGSSFYFTTTEGSGKSALWKSDGTTANTVKLASYNSVLPLIVFNGELYLSIDNGSQGLELFKTSGTVPAIVKDINPGSGSGFNGELMVSNNLLFFKANSGSGGVNIWKSNSTEAGTTLAVDLPFDDYQYLTDVNGIIYFARNYDGKAELWKTNGTTATTVLVKKYALNDDPANDELEEFISNFISLNGKLYFDYFIYTGSLAADDLYESDGTESGTIAVDNIVTDGYVDFLTKALNKLVYQGDSQGFPGYIKVYDSFSSTSSILSSGNGDVKDFAQAGNLFFYSNHIDAEFGAPSSSENTFQLWQSDLTTANTFPVKNLFKGTSFPGTDNITPAGNKIFFTTQLTGPSVPLAMRIKRLWYYDPTLPVVPIPYFTVENADTDQEMQVLEMGDEVEIPTGVNINIRYHEIGKPGSVVFKLADTIRRIESSAPYLLAGDNNGNYSPWLDVKEGLQKLTAIPFSLAGGNGTPGNPLTVVFSIKFQDIPPIVDLGPDRTIQLPKDTVIITVKVTDPDSESFLYFWNYQGGSTVSEPPVLVENGKQLFVSNLKEGFYDFSVFVSDQEGGSGNDVIRITVTKATGGGMQIVIVNATTDLDIRELLQNDTIHINPSSDKITIRAIPNQAVGSVQFFLNGKLNRNENVAPYALQGDLNGDYTPWTPAAGNYLLEVKSFSGSSGSGTLIASKISNLVVINDNVNPAQISFTLVNAITNQDIGPLVNGQFINLANLPTNKLNVRANSTLANTKSVIFAFDGNSKFRTENTAPYALFGDSNGDYADWAAVVGSHNLKATPFTGMNGSGTSGISLAITFTIVNSTNAFKTASLKTYPNPTEENLSVDIENFESENVSILIYDEYGSLYYEGKHVILNGAGNYQIDLKDLNMNPGIYFVKIRSLNSNDEKVVKIIKR